MLNKPALWHMMHLQHSPFRKGSTFFSFTLFFYKRSSQAARPQPVIGSMTCAKIQSNWNMWHVEVLRFQKFQFSVDLFSLIRIPLKTALYLINLFCGCTNKGHMQLMPFGNSRQTSQQRRADCHESCSFLFSKPSQSRSGTCRATIGSR